MGVRFKVLSGEMMGEEFDLSAGEKIGRSSANFNVPDPNISGTHCALEINPIGRYCLIDLESSNGIKHLGVKLRSLVLEEKMQFTLGKTLFEVLEVPDGLTPAPMVLEWQGRLRTLMTEPFTQTPVQTKPFPYPVVFEVIQGSLLGLKKVLHYGPRSCGYLHYDIDLKLPSIPFNCFEVFFKEGVLQIRNLMGSNLLINGQEVSDTVSIGPSDRVQIDQLVIRLTPYSTQSEREL